MRYLEVHHLKYGPCSVSGLLIALGVGWLRCRNVLLGSRRVVDGGLNLVGAMIRGTLVWLNSLR